MPDPHPDRLNLPSDQDATGRTLGEEELASLREVIRRGTLISTKGTFVKEFQDRFAARLGVRHALACSSGTAAIHCAVAALDLEPGDEVITSPITDMGALAPLLYQGLIPVFADVDPATYTVTADTIRQRLSPKTRAVVVTHLFGYPADMDPILDLAKRHQLAVIEDCAQAFLAEDRGRLVGTMGTIGCFSLQQGKHITTGEGGLVVTNDAALARRIELFINKAWGYGDANPDHYFLALNYRMSELAGAVGLAQLLKLDEVVQRRVVAAHALSHALRGLAGVDVPAERLNARHVFWKYCLRVDPGIVAGGVGPLAATLREAGIAAVPRYIQKPAFACAVFSEQRTFGRSRYPFTLARPEALDYSPQHFPGTTSALERIIVIPWNERYTEHHVAGIARAITDAVANAREPVHSAS
jgi:perosamine synthetase